MSVCPFLDGLEYCVLDIETTGFSPQANGIISVSFFYPESEDRFQLFCDEPGLEIPLLKDCVDRMAECDAVITYNGDTFDLPFIHKRAIKKDVCRSMPLFKSLDVYKYLRRYWPAAKLMESLSQRSVESALGIADERTDRIDGGQCVELYGLFLATGDENCKEKILLHNLDDVKQLGRIFAALNFLPWQLIGFNEGYPLRVDRNEEFSEMDLLSMASAKDDAASRCGYKKSYVIGSCIENGILSVRGRTEKDGMPVSIFKDSYKYEYSSSSGAFMLEVPLMASDGMLLADLRELPVDESSFTGLPGCGSGYLIISDKGNVNAAEANKLSMEMLKELI